jgi:hypothetical protein
MKVTREPLSTYFVVRTSHEEAAGQQPRRNAPRVVREDLIRGIERPTNNRSLTAKSIGTGLVITSRGLQSGNGPFFKTGRRRQVRRPGTEGSAIWSIAEAGAS